MRILMLLALCLWSVGIVAAQDLGNQAPAKMPQHYLENIPDPVRQGGDIVGTATVIPSLPYNDVGTTEGFDDDYDYACPYLTSTSPDVVYKYVATANQTVVIDLCGSSYDTKVYVCTPGMQVIACNDDYYFGAPCGPYVSRLENVPLVAGGIYYIVVDGYGYAYGDYVLDVSFFVPCTVACPADGVPEDEPPLVDEYVDHYNGGCYVPGYPFQTVDCDGAGNRTLCGVSGWYLSAGSNLRDTDWYLLMMGPGGEIEITADAEYATYIFELGPQDCSAVGVIQSTMVGPCAEGFLSITGYPYLANVWFWVGPTVFTAPGPDTSYDYVVWFSGIWGCVVPNEPTTWSAVKALYE